MATVMHFVVDVTGSLAIAASISGFLAHKLGVVKFTFSLKFKG